MASLVWVNLISFGNWWLILEISWLFTDIMLNCKKSANEKIMPTKSLIFATLLLTACATTTAPTTPTQINQPSAKSHDPNCQRHIPTPSHVKPWQSNDSDVDIHCHWNGSQNNTQPTPIKSPLPWHNCQNLPHFQPVTPHHPSAWRTLSIIKAGTHCCNRWL